MKKHNYVVAISMIALLVQSGGACAMGQAGRWIKEKAAAVKGATVDSLYKKTEGFFKEVKALQECHKNKNCTPEQYQKIKKLALGAAAVAVALAAGIGFGVRKYRMSPEQLMKRAVAKFEVNLTSSPTAANDKSLLEAVAYQSDRQQSLTMPKFAKNYSSYAIEAAGDIVRQTVGENTVLYQRLVNLHNANLGFSPLYQEILKPGEAQFFGSPPLPARD